MVVNKNIRRWMIIATWALMSLGLVVLLVSAISRKKSAKVKETVVSIAGASNYVFVDENAVQSIVKMTCGGAPTDMTVAAIDLEKIESALEKEAWIRNAELFIDNNNLLQIRIDEREPVARVFDVSGESFYVDSTALRLPVNNNTAVRIAVFTGFAGTLNNLAAKDSAVLLGIKSIGMHLAKDSFWNAQVTQVDITPEGEFVLLPLLGNHQILFGNGEMVSEKFSRLSAFYQQVLVKTGLNKYEKIDVRFERQVVATRRGASVGNIDTTQAVITMNNLLASAERQMKDTAQPVVVNANVAATTMNEGNLDLLPANVAADAPAPATVRNDSARPSPATAPKPAPQTTTPKPITQSAPKPAVRQQPKPSTTPSPKPANSNTPKPKPKAVMPVKNK
jgi:cell division protein FtsQ